MIAAAPRWSHVLEEAQRLTVKRGGELSSAVCGVLTDLVLFAAIRSPEPVVSSGEEGAVRLDWPGLSLEVLDDRIEVYPQSPPDSAFAVWFEDHRPGEGFSDDFERILPKLPDWEARRPDRR